MAYLTGLLFIAVFFQKPTLADITFNCNGVHIEVAEGNGSVELVRTRENGDDTELNVHFLSIVEKDADGKAIETDGKSIDDFHTVVFNLPDKPDDDASDSMSAKKYEYNGIWGEATTFTVTLLFFKKDGELHIGNEPVKVDDGGVKLQLKVSNWTFCSDSNCPKFDNPGKQIGEFLDLTLGITKIGDAAITMSNKTKIDNDTEWMVMPGGYPMEMNDTYVVRLPKFMNNVQYEVILMLGPQEDTIIATEPPPPPTTTEGATSLGLSITFAGMAIIFIISILKTLYY